MTTYLHAALAMSGTAVLGYTTMIYTNLGSTRKSQILSTASAPDSLKHSRTNRDLVNPNKHISFDDSRELRLTLDKPLTDEQILARFTRGFFNSWSFAPECTILNMVRPNLVQIAKLEHVPVSGWIWSPKQLSRETLPPIHTTISGAFRIVDSLIRDRETSTKGSVDSAPATESESYVDIVFGSDNGALKGVHRFSVLRHASDHNAQSNTDEVTVRFSHTGCNPRKDKPLKPEVLGKFHVMYAMLLFREAIGEVLKD